MTDTFLASVVEAVNKIVSASTECKFYHPDWEEHWGEEAVYMEAEVSRRLRKEKRTRSRLLGVKEGKNVKETVNHVKYGRDVHLNKT